MDNYFIFFALFIFLSAIFSSSETAFFSLSKIQIKKLEMNEDSTSKLIVKLLKRPRKLLITILLGNTIVNVAASTFGALMVVHYAKAYLGFDSVPLWLLAVSMVIITVVLIIFGEITPKLFAISKAETLARLFSGFLAVFSFLLYPLIIMLVFISQIFSHKIDGQHFDRTNFTSEDLRNIVDSKSKYHPLNENEKKIISGIFRFSSTEAKKIMVPRVDIKSVSINDDLDTIKLEINQSGHSRLPVCKKNIDDLMGIVYAKDIILNPNLQSINSIVRKPIYVTEKTKIQTLLNLFLAKKTHLAIVVDEYGGTSGLVSLEDILEELVGEIIDEYDKEQPLLTKKGDNEYIASGMLSISELNRVLDIDIDIEKYDNLAAFLYDRFNHVPSVGEKLNYNDVASFVIVSINGQRIENVKIVKTVTDNEIFM